MTQQSFTLNIAVAAPVFGTFDYLPLAGSEESDYPPGIRVAIPFGRRNLVGVVLSLKKQQTPPPPKKEHFKLKAIKDILDDKPLFKPKQLHWLQWAARYYCHPIGDVVAHALPALLRKPDRYRPSKIGKWELTDASISLPSNARRQAELLQLLQQHEHGLWHDTVISMGYTRQHLERLADKGAIRETLHDPLLRHEAKANPLSRLQLNPEQQLAVEQLKAASQHFGVHLLEGVTGSGKTEVYIELVDEALSHGRQVLILVPEINLTPQTLQRFQARLDIPICTYHSAMSDREKTDTWLMTLSGSARVIVGTRSAIFAPMPELGLIIIDEEHDSSFKQFDGFKYSARDIAIKRAHLEDIPVILGSATPSLETLANVASGRYEHMQLKHRASGARLPSVSTIDVRALPLENGLSTPLLEAASQALMNGKQVVLFQNRRGYSPTLMCGDCGWLAQCTHCDVRLTVHRHPAHLHCHHCNFQTQFPAHCPSCNSAQLLPLGAGTERLEYALQQRFHDTPIYRMDRDTITTQNKLHQFLDNVNRGEPCIVVGTQMIAKGHDFKHVALVGIIDADGLFFSADFRAMERGAQLLTQVAGRAGRHDTPGSVLIQTRQPEHEIFKHIAQADYASIARTELEVRETCDLPPFSRMISIRADAKHANLAESKLLEIAHYLETQQQRTVACTVAGPFEALIHRRSGLYRYFLQLFFDDPAEKQRVCDWLALLLAQDKSSAVRLSIDVDPLEYL
ncbi:MAG: primosomal protein N' [Oleiphilaceae bacterium]|nr:primosomal protein N' [Oleiphilaceae bacterium]